MLFKKVALSFCIFTSPLLCFTDLQETYTTEYCQSIEEVYGENLLSAGGTQQIDAMFEGIDLTGKKLLDFGCGYGGVAYHLAHLHDVEVVGVDVLQSMITHCTHYAPYEIAHKLSFEKISLGHLPFDDNSFDIIYSKEVLLHVSNSEKALIFSEFYRILKPGGYLIINDWLSYKNNHWCPEIQQIIDDENQLIYAVEQNTYLTLLKNAQFTSIICKNLAQDYIKHNEATVQKLSQEPLLNYYLQTYGKQYCQEQIQSYKNIAKALEEETLLICNIIARK